MPNNPENTDTLWVCVDCYFTHHGAGESDNTPDREPLSLIPEGADVTSGMFWEQHECLPDTPRWENVPSDHECDCERRDFSWSHCQGCGSTLGGSREVITVWYAA